MIMTVATSPKTAATVSAATTGTGATFLYWIPNDIGKLATLVGIILSIMLIKLHFTMLKKLNMEMEDMRKEREERKNKVESRRSKGEPCVRACDET